MSEDELRAQLAACQQELRESKEEYEEFVASSRELEAMLQGEIERAEEDLKRERTAKERAMADKSMLQERLSKETRELAGEIEKLKEELQLTKAENSGLLTARQHLEQSVDDLERRERQAEATADDSTAKLEELLEQKILLQSDMEEQMSLSTEQQQRLKDEIRDLKDELDAARRKSEAQPPASASRGSPASAAASPLSTRGLVVIGDMLKRVKDMEERLAGCRSSLGQMLSSREGTPRSKRTTPRHTPKQAAKGSPKSPALPSLNLNF